MKRDRMAPIIATFGPTLARQMADNARAIANRCPTCGAGSGRQCVGGQTHATRKPGPVASLV